MRDIVIAGLIALVLAAQPAVAQQQSSLTAAEAPRGETIVWVAQGELHRAGLYDGPRDGVASAETIEAVEEFEHMVGWPESGRITPDLIIAVKRYNLMVLD